MKKFMFTWALAAAALISFQSCGDSTGGEEEEQPDVYDYQTDGIQGHWLSEGDNVAPLLSALLNVKKITATFNKNNTYTVVSYDTANAVTTYTGTYVQTKSSVSGIWNITLSQTVPYTGVSEGIFQITKTGDDYTMKYEVVITEPDYGNSTPTASGGFGSSNGGALGVSNIQVFERTGDL